MKYHGLVSLAFLALGPLAFGQEASIPRLLGAPDVSRSPENRANLRSVAPPPSMDMNGNASMLEAELGALHADLQSFHAVSEDVARSARDLEIKSDRVSLQQRQEVLDLMTKLATQGIARRAAKEQEPASPLPKLDPLASGLKESGSTLAVTDSTVDPFALGKVLFRSGDFAKAEQAFRRVPLTDENRDLLKYMIATCKYRRKQFQEAMEGYREIAASNDDPVIRDLAKFQLDGIRWRQEVDQELEQLRKQREKQSGGLVHLPDNRSGK